VEAALTAIDNNANDIAQLASLAKAKASETLHLVSTEMVQMHGGIGMTDEHDIGLFMKREAVLGELFGDVYYHRARVAALSGY